MLPPQPIKTFVKLFNEQRNHSYEKLFGPLLESPKECFNRRFVRSRMFGLRDAEVSTRPRIFRLYGSGNAYYGCVLLVSPFNWFLKWRCPAGWIYRAPLVGIYSANYYASLILNQHEKAA